MFVFLWFLLVIFIIIVGFIVLFVSLRHYLKNNKNKSNMDVQPDAKAQ